MSASVISFPPILASCPRILILGTMPGVPSLRAVEYYANPNNAFWKILSAIQNIECPKVYEEKKQLIQDMGLALWDVCYSCVRPGSADSDIREVIPNPITELLDKYPSIQTIVFNGQTAEKLFHRYLKKPEGVKFVTMPSTSPAHTMPFGQKLEAWRQAIPESNIQKKNV